MARWLPDRKVVAGGLAGIGAWLVMLVFRKLGFELDPEMQPALATLFGTAIAYMVPPSQRDILLRLDDTIVKLAQDDPTIPVSKPK